MRALARVLCVLTRAAPLDEDALAAVETVAAKMNGTKAMNENLMTVPANGKKRRRSRRAGPAPMPRSARGRVLTALGRVLAYSTATPSEWGFALDLMSRTLTVIGGAPIPVASAVARELGWTRCFRVSRTAASAYRTIVESFYVQGVAYREANRRRLVRRGRPREH